MTSYLPPGRTVPILPPRPDAIAAIAAGAEARRRRTRNRALAAAVLALLVAAPLLVVARDTTTGLRPARRIPAPAPSATATNGPGIDGAGHVEGAGSSIPGTGTTLGTPGTSGSALAPPCACATPAADAPSGTLTVTGSRTGYGTVRLDRTTTVDLAATKVVTLRGEYAGLAIGDVEVLYVQQMDAGLAPSYLGADSVTLRPGTYRVYLFAPTGTETTVTVPWTSQPSRTVHPDVAVRKDFSTLRGRMDQTQSVANGIGTMDVMLVMARYGPAAPGVTMTGCLDHGPGSRAARCTTAESDGASLHLDDRITDEWAGWTYTVSARGDPVPAAGVTETAFFKYDRD